MLHAAACVCSGSAYTLRVRSCALYDLRPLKTLYVLMSASVVIIFGNIFRAVALFYLEAGIVEMPGWGHDYIGVVAFVLIAAGITASVRWIRREKLCAASQLST